MHALQENFEPTIIDVWCDWHCFASGSETNLGFNCLLFYVSVFPYCVCPWIIPVRNHLYSDRHEYRLHAVSCRNKIEVEDQCLKVIGVKMNFYTKCRCARTRKCIETVCN